MVWLTKEQPSTVNKRLALCFSLGLMLFSAGVALFVVDPIMLYINSKMSIYPGSPVHELMKKKFSIRVATYLFNISNADRFMAGLDPRLKVQEVGPFTYKETRENEHLELDMEAGVIRYEPRLTHTFLPEESVGRPEDMNLTLPNLPMLGAAHRVSSYSSFIRMSFNLLTARLGSKPVVSTDANSYLWGYRDPLLTLSNTLVPGLVDMDEIGLLDRFYNEDNKNRLEINASGKNKFMVRTRNGYKKLQMVNYQNPNECSECDTFKNAYEGMAYPTPVLPDTPIKIFRTGICRIVDMVFHEKKILDYNVEGLVFNVSDSFFSTPNITYKGLLDVSTCFYGLPIYVSKAHLLDVDQIFQDRVEGLKPDRNKHVNYITIEPKIGMNLETRIMVQLNFVLGDLSYNSAAKSFSNMVVPIGYLVFSQEKLADEAWAFLKLIYFTRPLLMVVTRATLLLLSCILLGYSLRQLFCKKNPGMLRENTKTSEEPLVGKDTFS